jgi:hypothetical protein
MPRWRLTVAGGGISEARGSELATRLTQLQSPRVVQWSFEGQPTTVTVVEVQVEASSESEARERGLELVKGAATGLGLTIDARIREVRELTEEGKGVSR